MTKREPKTITKIDFPDGISRSRKPFVWLRKTRVFGTPKSENGHKNENYKRRTSNSEEIPENRWNSIRRTSNSEEIAGNQWKSIRRTSNSHGIQDPGISVFQYEYFFLF